MALFLSYPVITGNGFSLPTGIKIHFQHHVFEILWYNLYSHAKSMTGRPGVQLNLNAKVFNRVDTQPLRFLFGQFFNILACLQGNFIAGSFVGFPLSHGMFVVAVAL